MGDVDATSLISTTIATKHHDAAFLGMILEQQTRASWFDIEISDGHAVSADFALASDGRA